MRRRPLALALALAALMAALGACGTGPRPALGAPVAAGTQGTPTGVASVDPLLQRLEAVPAAPFTATYAITRKLGGATASATVAHEGDLTAVTIGDVRFLDGVADETCALAAATCEAGLQEQRISELAGVTSQFWSTSTAQALRVTTGRRSGEPEAAPATIAGLPVDCVRIAVGAGVEQYCVSAAGPIASVDRADYTIELTAWSDTADPAALARPA